MFRLAHLSDIHLGPLPDLAYRDLVSKRITGYINWRRNRRSNLHEDVIDRIVDAMQQSEPDHIVVSGDLMNLALASEIELSRLWLQSLGDPHHVSVVPGNHDAYVPGALDKTCAAWAPWMQGDTSNEPARRGSFPYMRIRGDVAVIGVNSARATAPFMASGFFGESQAKRLGTALDEAGRRGLCRVIVIHHPPVRGAAASHKRLLGIGRFHEVMTRHGADLVLHGHTHLPTTYRIRGRDGEIPVVGVAAAGQAARGERPPGQFNLFEIEGTAGAWRIGLTRRGISAGNAQVHTIATESLA